MEPFIRVGIVGLGFMAATHIKAYRSVPGARIVAICNPSGRNLDGDFSKVSGNVGSTDPVLLEMTGIRATTCFEDLLVDDSIQLIDICSPTLAHPALVKEALARGKHVLCEKPFARTSALAREMVQAAQSAKTFCMPAMCLRFWPEWRWLKEAISDGRYGQVLAARFRRVAEPPAWGKSHFPDGAKSGGALLDLHIHDTDFVHYCFGRPSHVFSTGYTKYTGAIDHVVTQYRVRSGASVHAEGSWAMAPGFGFSMSYTVNFERATADYDVARGAESLKLAEEGKGLQVIPFTEPDGYVGEIAHLIDCIRSRGAPQVVTAADGLSSVQICEAEEKSIATNAIVEVPGQ